MSLEERVKGILQQADDMEGAPDWWKDEATAQIIQAFKDAGYEVELKNPFEKGWNRGYKTAEYVCTHSNHMTGAEWYARFERQYHMSADWIAGDPSMGEEAERDVLSAAKRAAGVEGKK